MKKLLKISLSIVLLLPTFIIYTIVWLHYLDRYDLKLLWYSLTDSLSEII